MPCRWKHLKRKSQASTLTVRRQFLFPSLVLYLILKWFCREFLSLTSYTSQLLLQSVCSLCSEDSGVRGAHSALRALTSQTPERDHGEFSPLFSSQLGWLLKSGFKYLTHDGLDEVILFLEQGKKRKGGTTFSNLVERHQMEIKMRPCGKKRERANKITLCQSVILKFQILSKKIVFVSQGRCLKMHKLRIIDQKRDKWVAVTWLGC